MRHKRSWNAQCPIYYYGILSMKILWITSIDEYLLGAQFKNFLETHTESTCDVISFLAPSIPDNSSIIIERLESLEQEYQLPHFVEKIRNIIKNSDLVISSTGLIKEYEDINYKKFDGAYATICGIKLWLETMRKNKIHIIFSNNAINYNPEYFAKCYSAMEEPFITYDYQLYRKLSDYMDINFISPVFEKVNEIRTPIDKLFIKSGYNSFSDMLQDIIISDKIKINMNNFNHIDAFGLFCGLQPVIVDEQRDQLSKVIKDLDEFDSNCALLSMNNILQKAYGQECKF